MRALLPLAASVAVFALAMPAKANDKQDCTAHKDNDRRVAACSKVIQLTPGDAAAHHNRGDARQRKGELDNAIADFSKAIEIDPGLARAYDGRGRAYASKGDYTRAVLDVTKASELAPKQAQAAKKPPAKAVEPTPAKPPVRTSKALAKAAPEYTWPAWAVIITD